jgi:cytochrome c oxidase accessory protein FixG
MVVAYDHVRGEQRAKFRKGEVRSDVQKGDCIDCAQCVHVCPTGIDIRNGTQLECINCTACIDACNTMMTGVGMEKGLIRFVSENGIKNRSPFQWTRRVKAYTALLIGLLAVLIIMLANRDDFQTIILRQRGSTYQITDDNRISNIFEIDLTNKTKHEFNVQLNCSDPKVEIDLTDRKLTLKSQKHMKDRFVIKTPYENVSGGMKKVDIIVLGNGKEIDRVGIKIIAPNF